MKKERFQRFKWLAEVAHLESRGLKGVLLTSSSIVLQLHTMLPPTLSTTNIISLYVIDLQVPRSWNHLIQTILDPTDIHKVFDTLLSLEEGILQHNTLLSTMLKTAFTNIILYSTFQSHGISSNLFELMGNCSLLTTIQGPWSFSLNWCSQEAELPVHRLWKPLASTEPHSRVGGPEEKVNLL